MRVQNSTVAQVANSHSAVVRCALSFLIFVFLCVAFYSQVWLRKARDLEACFTSKRPQSCNHSAPELTLSLCPPILFPTSPHGSKPVRLREIGVRCVWNVVAARAKTAHPNSHADDILCVGFHGDLFCPPILFPTSPHGCDPYD